MQVHGSILDSIGNTPLVKLKRASEETGCTILGKAEFLNPGQSVKDRAALAIIQDAEAKRQIERGGVMVEGTAGNTGIGLALVGAAKGYRTIVVMPRTQSQEKKDAVIALGAELVEVDAAPASSDNHYPKVAQAHRRRKSQDRKATARSGPTSSTMSPTARVTSTRRQGNLARKPSGKVDGFICAVGSGGTLGGVSAWGSKPKIRTS